MTCKQTTPQASVIDIVDGILRPALGSLQATKTATTIWLALRRAGLLKDEATNG